MIELLTAVILHTQSPVYIEPQPKVAIQVGESESGRREREEQELKEKEAEKRARITVKARESHQNRFESERYTSSSVEILYADSMNNCVQFSKQQSGINRVMGAGGRSAIQTQEPKVGAIGVLAGTPHAVYIEKIDGDKITFRESNYRRNFITRRTLPRQAFLGFIVS